jgi:tetratricopeptide (TPR) repeat protein
MDGWGKSVQRALALGPKLAEAHVRAAQNYARIGDLAASQQHCKRAIALSPSDPLVLTVSAGKAFNAGHWSEGISLQRRAVAIDPLAAVGHSNLGIYLMAVGEWQEAGIELQKAREISPTLPNIDSEIAKALILQQRFTEASAAIARIPAGPLQDQTLALAFRAPGQRQAADEALSRLIARTNAARTDTLVELAIAEAYAFRGEHDAALTWIARAVASNGPDAARKAQRAREEMTTSPFLRVLHADERWRSLVARADTG